MGKKNTSSVSPALCHLETKFQCLPPCFFGSSNPTETPRTMYDQTGRGKSEMATYKLEISISRPVNQIEAKFQRLPQFFRVRQSSKRLWILYDQTGSGKSKIVASKTGTTYSSACGWDKNEISTAKPTFSRWSNPRGLRGILCNQTGSGKSKMAASSLELLISRLVGEIETKSQRLNLHFRGQAIQWDWGEFRFFLVYKSR